MNIHKKALSLVLAIALVVSAFSGTTVFAAGSKTITVGDDGDQATLSDAMKVADSGDTIKLLSDLTVTKSVSIDKSVILDGNGKTITANGEKAEEGDFEEGIDAGNHQSYTMDTPSRVLEVAADGVTIQNITFTSGDRGVGVADFNSVIFINGHKDTVLKNLSFLRYNEVNMDEGLVLDGDQDSGCTAAEIYIDGNSTVTAEGTITSTQWSTRKPVIYVRPGSESLTNLTVTLGADVKIIRNGVESGQTEDVLTDGGNTLDNALYVPPILVELSSKYSKAQTSEAENAAAKSVKFASKNWKPSFIPAFSPSEIGYFNDNFLFSTVVPTSRINQNEPYTIDDDPLSTSVFSESQWSWTSSNSNVVKKGTDEYGTTEFTILKEGKTDLTVQSDFTAEFGSDSDNNTYWNEGDVWPFTGVVAVTVGTASDQSGSSSDANDVSDAIGNLKDSSAPADVASVVGQVIGLSSTEQKKLTESEINKLERLIQSVSDGAVTCSIPSPETGEFKDSGALPAAPAATGLLLAAGVTGQETEPVAVTLSTTQRTASGATVVSFDLTLTKQTGTSDPEELHSTLPFPVTITIQLPTGFLKQTNYTYSVLHTKTDGTTETLPLTLTGTDGNYAAIFTTTSFSNFSIVKTYSGSSSGGSSSSSSHHHSSSSSSSNSSSKSGSSTATTFTSDTNQDFSVNGTYQFKITSTNGAIPTFVVGTPGVFEMQLVSVSGNDYYFRLTAVGKPGDKAGIYVNGEKLLIATVKTTASLVKSDTTGALKIAKAKTYVFKLTANSKPSFTSGNSAVFQVKFLKQSGKNYFYQVSAVGRTGQAAGFYINSEHIPVAVATIA